MIPILPQQFVHREELDSKMQITLQNMWEELVLAINQIATNSIISNGTLSPDQRPSTFGVADAFNRLFYSTDYNHMYIWDGTEWDVIEHTSGQVCWYTVVPGTAGWHICDGSTGVMQSDEHGVLHSITVPDLITDHPYIRGGNAYSGPTASAAVVPSISGPSNTGSGGAHDHTGTPTGTVESPEGYFVSHAVDFGTEDLWNITGDVTASTDGGDLNPNASVATSITGTVIGNTYDCTSFPLSEPFQSVNNCGHVHDWFGTLDNGSVTGTWTHNHGVTATFTNTSVPHNHKIPIITSVFTGDQFTTSGANPSTHIHSIGSITATTAGEPTHMTLIPMFRL